MEIGICTWIRAFSFALSVTDQVELCHVIRESAKENKKTINQKIRVIRVKNHFMQQRNTIPWLV